MSTRLRLRLRRARPDFAISPSICGNWGFWPSRGNIEAAPRRYSGSSSSPSARPGTPRPTSAPNLAEATTTLADQQWALAQSFNRLALPETYRLRHGREPPASMNILRTSALERSLVIEDALMGAAGTESAETRRQREEARRMWARDHATEETEEERKVRERMGEEGRRMLLRLNSGADAMKGWRPAQSTMEMEMEWAGQQALAGAQSQEGQQQSPVSPKIGRAHV